ncbi:Putative inorganic phosphate cotransporter [Dufourea novaeangliae]|uniref:Putative inorganic phosphate cotransporter n=2 Tax=Dufourea novaeangliae TaxID=178035 RepID=A0A154PQW6_DUFNO|nr:Putative inorganic phosphate cotransporter [Dufourea novaeangliae]
MSEAIVAMTKSPSDDQKFKVYDWSPQDKSIILSSFFWGYAVMQIPSGYIAGVWSGQKLLSLGMLVCSVLNILIPTAAEYGNLIAVCVCRVCMGLCQSCLLPCTHTLLSKWAPPDERARLGAFSYAGGQFGTVISFPVSGFLATSSIGWPSVFYVFGALGIIWSIAFFIFGSDSPSEHSRISEMEKQYIFNSLKTSEQDDSQTKKMVKKTPWKALFTSVPMWALIIVHCGQNWGYWTLITEMPIYMNAVLKFDLQQNGMMSALPYLTMWILSFPASLLSDFALQKGVSRGVVRKVCNSVAHWGPAVALICLATIPIHNAAVVVTILVIAVGLNAGALCGFQINHIDLSPNFAGTMMSITNCVASVIAIVAPLICGVIVTDEENKTQWSLVFYLSAAVYIIGNSIFILFGKAEVQPWNETTSSTPKKQSRNESVTTQ